MSIILLNIIKAITICYNYALFVSLLNFLFQLFFVAIIFFVVITISLLHTIIYYIIFNQLLKSYMITINY